MSKTILVGVVAAATALSTSIGTPTANGQSSEKTLNHHIEESLRTTRRSGPSAGSLFSSRSYLSELGRDPKAASVGDLVTIQVVEQASALSSGATSSSRSSSSNHSVGSLLGALNPAGTLANLAASSGDRSLDGQGTTSRQTSVTATITAVVTHVMPNGNLVIEGVKEIAINSERQLVFIRGVARPVDLAQDNSIRSDRIAMMDLRVNGKGVVNDAIKRPNLLFRIIKGLLPF